MVICTCIDCKKKQVIVNGVSQPGRHVSATTRREHEQKNEQVYQPAAKPQRSKPKPDISDEKATGKLL